MAALLKSSETQEMISYQIHRGGKEGGVGAIGKDTDEEWSAGASDGGVGMGHSGDQSNQPQQIESVG